MLQSVRIRNFRSIESQDLYFGETTILFGKNDSGKSNIVRALEFAFDRPRQVDVSNVHISPTQPDSKETPIIVDVFFTGDYDADSDWLMFFSDELFNIEPDNTITFSFRTEARYSTESRSYERTRYVINNWHNEEIGGLLPYTLLDSIDFILLDAHRDIAEVIKNRSSRWNHEVRKADISGDEAEEIELRLAELGKSIVRASPFLTAAEDDLKGSTDRRASKVEIAPVARSLNELYRSTDVVVTEDNGLGISVSSFGAGTRSRAEFMAFKTLVGITADDAVKRGVPYYCLAVFEEPEAHIHPQSQQQLLVELSKIGMQRIVTTHSPYILSKAPLDSLVHVRRDGFVTTLIPMAVGLTDSQKRETERYLLRTHGELLFANVVVFVEGETEERALPVFFEHRYGKQPFEYGVTIVSVRGHKYEPYLRIVDKLGISWFVLSDAEPRVLNDVEKEVSRVFGNGASLSISDIPQFVTCRDGNNYERELIADGYGDVMIDAINAVNEDDSENAHARRLPHFESWMQRRRGADAQVSHSDPDERIRALEEFLKKNKVQYAIPIAERIVGLDDGRPTIPTYIEALFSKLDKVISPEGSRDV